MILFPGDVVRGGSEGRLRQEHADHGCLQQIRAGAQAENAQVNTLFSVQTVNVNPDDACQSDIELVVFADAAMGTVMWRIISIPRGGVRTPLVAARIRLF